MRRYALGLLALLLSGCQRTFTPSGKPGCTRGHTWSDSAWACVPRDSAKVTR